jgi:hypothetical protein
MADATVSRNHHPVPPPPGKGKTIGVRMHVSQIKQLDAWARQHGAIWHGELSRPEAVRRLIAAALTPPPR